MAVAEEQRNPGEGLSFRMRRTPPSRRRVRLAGGGRARRWRSGEAELVEVEGNRSEEQ